jgi:release factor glutamine methyltransferase
MHSPTKRLKVGNLFFEVNDDVYEPAEDSYLLADNLRVVEGESVLDLGTGSGILAVSSALQGGDVVAVDINPYAIRCAKANAKINRVSGRINFLQGDLFSALSREVLFDLVLFNAPYLPSQAGEEDTWLGRSWAGGPDGRLVVDRFISEVSAHLKLDGRVLLMQSTLTGTEQTIQKFAEHSLTAVVLVSQSLPFFETLTLIEAKRINTKNV